MREQMLDGGLCAILPDDRPVTALCVVEQASRCPANFTAVLKTYDQDVDADLWKDGFWRRETRYLCLSKTQPNSAAPVVVDYVAIVGERDTATDRCVMLPQTADTGSRAWKRRQLVYRASAASVATRCVVDVIVLSRQKSCPDGFNLVGDLNGLTICCKYANNSAYQRGVPQQAHAHLNNSVTAGAWGYGGGGRAPAAAVAPAVATASCSTLAQAYSALDGVAFRLHARLQSSLAQRSQSVCGGVSDQSTLTAQYPLNEDALDKLVSYDFSTEYAVLQQS